MLYAKVIFFHTKARGATDLVSLTNQFDVGFYRKVLGGVDAIGIIEKNPDYVKAHNLVKENGKYIEIVEQGPPRKILQYEFTSYDIDISLSKAKRFLDRYCK